MSDINHTIPLPARRRSLVMRSVADGGQFVVKSGQGSFYDLGEHSYFLLEQLDGRVSAEEVHAAYQARYGEPLTAEELAEFLTTARSLDFLLDDDPALPSPTQQSLESRLQPAKAGTPATNSLLHFRLRLIDPDRLLTRLAPALWFFWTPAFVLIVTLCILAATVVAWSCRAELVRSLTDALAWRTVLLAWVTLGVVTVLHEFAHGLTCKHFGGEVRDMGFLMLFFMPCFYANVSDAWLFPKRSQRLWVTFAGGYFELWLWALAVFAWTVLEPGTLPGRIALLIVTLCGVQTLFNFNPLIKLDGYYLLSDWLGLANLRERAMAQVMACLRRWLWGAPTPEPEPHRRVLLVYGLLSLAYSLAFLATGLLVLGRAGGRYLGVAGWGFAGLLALLSLGSMFPGISQGEVKQMLRLRRGRRAAWLAGLSAVPLALSLIPITDRAGGPFQLRRERRVELRARVAGFIQELYADEDSAVSTGAVLAVLDVPDLASRTEQKRAEVREAQARLRLLEAGARPEERAEQRRRIERGITWRDQAAQALEAARAAFAQDLKQLDEQTAQFQAQLDYACDVLERSRRLRSQGAQPEEQLREAEKERRVATALLAQVGTRRQARQVLGTIESETELVRRERELADDRAKLALLEAGCRPEEIEADRARLTRLEEELRHLGQLKEKTQVVCPSAGVIVTPRLREKVGQFVKEGDLIALLEEAGGLEAEVALPEGESARVCVGQQVSLKVRALPHETFAANVVRLAPAATRADPARPDETSTLTVTCRLDSRDEQLRSGMTGYARIYSEERSLGDYLLDRAVRFVRTEFWW